jgi:large subunit ribosomal protein L4
LLLPVFNTSGEEVGTVDLIDAVFGVPENPSLLHLATVIQQGNARQGNADTKTRGEVHRGGAKMWRQKGTGRARQGSRKAPHFRGGGVVFGPHPRDYRRDIPKKARRLALKCALSGKAADGDIVLLESLAIAEPKTRLMADVLGNLNISRSVLIILPVADENIIRSARNIPGVKLLPAESLNVVDVLGAQRLLMPVDAAHRIETLLG